MKYEVEIDGFNDVCCHICRFRHKDFCSVFNVMLRCVDYLKHDCLRTPMCKDIENEVKK